MGNNYEINTPKMAQVRLLDQCFANPENLINKVIEEMDNKPDLNKIYYAMLLSGMIASKFRN